MRIKVYKARNIFEKTFGLMFRNKVYPLYFETRWGIHTFFVRREITILILDASNKIVKIKKVKPNRIYFWNPKYKKVLELPKGFLSPRVIKVGEIVRTEP